MALNKSNAFSTNHNLKILFEKVRISEISEFSYKSSFHSTVLTLTFYLCFYENWILKRDITKIKPYEESVHQKCLWGVSAVAQRDRGCLESAGTWVWSPALHSGLKIQHCHSCSLGCNCSSDLIPGNSKCRGAAKNEKKKKILWMK